MTNTLDFTIFDPLPRRCRKDPYKSLRCTHHHKNLRACWLPKGHQGLHTNPNCGESMKWSDNEGSYIHTKEDWLDHVDQFCKRGKAGEFYEDDSIESDFDRFLRFQNQH